MLRRISFGTIIAALITAGVFFINGVLAAAAGPATADNAAQENTRLALDMDGEGNYATSVGFIDSCAAVDVDDTFTVDVLVQRVSELVAWEVYLQYDRTRLEVVSRYVGDRNDDPLFLRVSSGSSVVDVSDPVPNRSGLYRLAAADIASPPATEGGSGVIARVTLQARAAGLAALRLPHLDYNKDGQYDFGPRLITLGGEEIGDSNGDGFLDSPGQAGHVAIGSSSCDDAPPPGAATDGSSGAGQPTGAPATTGEGSDGTPGGDGSGDGTGDGTESDNEETEAEPTPEDDEESSVADVDDDPDGSPGSGRDRPGGGGDGFLEPWMALPVIALGLLGLLFGVVALRRRGLGL